MRRYCGGEWQGSRRGEGGKLEEAGRTTWRFDRLVKTRVNDFASILSNFVRETAKASLWDFWEVKRRAGALPKSFRRSWVHNSIRESFQEIKSEVKEGLSRNQAERREPWTRNSATDKNYWKVLRDRTPIKKSPTLRGNEISKRRWESSSVKQVTFPNVGH